MENYPIINQKKEKTIYDTKGNKIYKGDFLDFKYHGEGTLYFENSNKIFFIGIFEMNKLINGKLYDLEGNITYEGKLIDNIPIK